MALIEASGGAPGRTCLAVHLHTQLFDGRACGPVILQLKTTWDGLRFEMATKGSTASADAPERALERPDAETAGQDLAYELVSQHCPVYNEQAFRYFLELERKRFARSNRRFLLLLVELEGGAESGFSQAALTTLFSSLWSCLRETDFVGWYEKGTTIGAVLTQLTDNQAEAGRVIVKRVHESFGKRLPADLARRTRLRVFQLPSKSISWS